MKTYQIVFSVIFLALLCVIWGSEIGRLIPLLGLEESVSLGDWGDSYGAINAFVSSLALLGIGLTVKAQHQTNLRQEKESNRTEFERRFFTIFGLIRELRKELEFSKLAQPYSPIASNSVSTVSKVTPQSSRKVVPLKGAEALKQVYTTIDKSVKKSNLIKTPQDLKRVYDFHVNRKHEGEFGPYFRMIYTILREIDREQHITEEEKIKMSRLVRSQMSSHEAIILGMNGLTEQSRDLKNYIEKYRMLKYSKDGDIKEILKTTYEECAFTER